VRARDLRFSRILVSGATGFLGQALIQRLTRNGHCLTALGRRQATSPFGSEVEYHSCDLSNEVESRRLLDFWRWDAVVHLAGPRPSYGASEDALLPSQHMRILNHLALSIPRGWPGRFIHISSMTVYGLPQYLPVDEEHPRRPLNLYGAAKLVAEDAMIVLQRRSDPDVWILRLPGLFSDTRRSGALYDFIRARMGGGPLKILPVTPTPWDVLHRDDAIEAICLALETPVRNGGAVNIGYGRVIELTAMAELIAARWSGSSGPAVLIENTGGARHPPFQMEIRKAVALLDWSPRTLESRLDDLWSTAVLSFQRPIETHVCG